MIEEIQDKASSLLKGKKKWIWIAGAGAVVLFAVMASRKKETAPDVGYPELTTDSLGGLPNNGSGSGTPDTGYIDSQIGNLYDLFDKSMTERDKYWQDLLNKQGSQLDKLQNQLGDMYDSSPIFGGSYSSGYGSLFPSSIPTTPTGQYGINPVTGQPYRSDYERVGYTSGFGSAKDSNDIKQNVKDLHSSQTYRDEEIKRAEAVIKYRADRGLDTSAQEKYVKDIEYIDKGHKEGYGTTKSDKDAKAVNDRLKADKDYREQEAKRTKDVIDYRESRGLDTKAQKDYLDRIKKSG